MNERIKELAEQNGFIHNWMPPGEQYELLQRYEKFSELIVRECALTAGLMEQANRPNIGAGILDSFGVEE